MAANVKEGVPELCHGQPYLAKVSDERQKCDKQTRPQIM